MADLKNIKQIGNPTDNDKIYVTDRAYKRMHKETKKDRRVFVLMGHTECAPFGYTSFVESVIPVENILYDKGIPLWDNHIWNEVFTIVKKYFENSVIIGWAIDIRGLSPRMTSDLEAVHKEHFGGAHQLLLLMDSLEKEEFFYQNKSGILRQKEGFYIYFDANRDDILPENIWKTIQEEKREEKKRMPEPHPRYRELMYEKKVAVEPDKGKWISSLAFLAAVFLLFAILHTGIKQGRFSVEEVKEAVESISTKVVGVEQIGEMSEDAPKTSLDIPAVLKDMENEDFGEYIETEQVPGGETLCN